MKSILRQALARSLSRPERRLAERGKEVYDADGDVIVAECDDSSDEEWLNANADD